METIKEQEKQVAQVGEEVHISFIGRVVSVSERGNKMMYQIVDDSKSKWSHEQQSAFVLKEAITNLKDLKREEIQ